MIPIAGIEGNLIFLIVAAAVGVINWWMEKKKKESQSESEQRPPQTPRSTPSDASGGTDEQERLRRFLEALGVPQGQQPPKPQPAPQVPRPRPTPAPQPRRVMQTPRPAPKPTPRAVPVPKPKFVPEPEEFAEAGRLEEAASSIERIGGEFEAMNVRVAMPSFHAPETPAHLTTKNAGTTSVLEREGNPLVASLRRTLTNPKDIRAAFLAAELLGKPKGLQP
jgi:hypothetical protein